MQLQGVGIIYPYREFEGMQKQSRNFSEIGISTFTEDSGTNF